MEESKLVYSVGPNGGISDKEIKFTKDHGLRWDDRGYFVWYQLRTRGRIKRRILR